MKISQASDFDKLIRKAQKLQELVGDLQPFLELVRQLDGKEIVTVPKFNITEINPFRGQYITGGLIHENHTPKFTSCSTKEGNS